MQAQTITRWPTVASLRDRFYPDVARRDAVGLFVSRMEQLVRPGDAVLDLGAGAGELNAYTLKSRARVFGVDADPRVSQNPLLHAGLQADVCALPFRSGSFDVVFSIYVLEHAERPADLVSEVGRVLKPGGLCVFLTPNVCHYVTVISRLTPVRFHRWVNKRRGRSDEDTFPTFYRLNSSRALQRHFGRAGFDTVALDTIEVQPNYLTFSAATYAIGIGVERLLNSSELFATLRVNLVGVFRKPHTVRA